MRFEMPEDALPSDHKARLIWRVVEGLDLSRFFEKYEAVEGRAGRNAVSVRMLLTLWLYAVSVNVGSAREIERLIESDAAFRWIVGDCRVGRSTLSSFRVAHREALDQLLTDLLAQLLHKKLLQLDLVAQDGTRVRASAASTSFHQYSSLVECRAQAQLHLKAVLNEGGDLRAKRAREAKARDYEQRVEAAITEVQAMLDKPRSYVDISRASTTDPEAKVMRMGDGAFRPAYNVQLATAGDPVGGPRTIVGVRVTNVGSDQAAVEPMLDEIERRTGALPKAIVADADHSDRASIEGAAARGVRPVIASSKREKSSAPRSPAVNAWLEDIRSDDAKSLLRARPSLAELTNAHAKTRFTMSSLLVRGTAKVTCVVLFIALTSNILAHGAALLL